jgi:hypothetical protein
VKKQTPGGDKNQQHSRLMGESGFFLSSMDRLMRVAVASVYTGWS